MRSILLFFIAFSTGESLETPNGSFSSTILEDRDASEDTMLFNANELYSQERTPVTKASLCSTIWYWYVPLWVHLISIPNNDLIFAQ
ncbi:unknown [Bacteroides sp. CAG:545]|nr:unknown [Bacteroides sp. CAG:545]